jgi:hypothetical protein
MLIGQLFLIIAVGKVISSWSPSRRAGAAVDQTLGGDDPRAAGSSDHGS